MRFARSRAEFNHRFVNKLVRPLSGRVAMWSIIEHRGRRSGVVYRTPMGGATFDVAASRIVPTREAARQLASPWRQIVRRTSTPTTMLLRRLQSEATADG